MFLGFQKNEYFLGMKILWIFWGGGGITKLDYIQGSFLCMFGSFFNVKVQNGGIFGGCKNFKHFWGFLKFLFFFLFVCFVLLWGGGGG